MEDEVTERDQHMIDLGWNEAWNAIEYYMSEGHSFKEVEKLLRYKINRI